MIPNLIKNMIFSPFKLAWRIGKWVIFLAIIVGVFFLLSFDLNDYKEDIEKRASTFLKQEMKINGDVKLGVDGFRPSIVLKSVSLGSDRGQVPMNAESIEFAIPFSIPDTKNPWEVFTAFQNVVIDGRRVGDYELPIRFSKTGFSVPELKGELDDARLEGHVSFENGVFDLDVKAIELDYSHVANGVKGGNVKMDITLKSNAPTPDRIVSGLNGRIFIAGEVGEMAGNAVNFWAGDLLTSVLSGPQKETEINCVIADFKVTSGVAHSSVIIIDTARVTIFGKGTVDFLRGRVDMKFTPKPKNPSLVSFATPVIVSGPFGNIQASPEPAAMAKKFGGILLGVINPAAALLPMMERGVGSGNPCLAHLRK